MKEEMKITLVYNMIGKKNHSDITNSNKFMQRADKESKTMTEVQMAQ